MLVKCNEIINTENDDKTVSGLSSSDVSRLSPPELMAEALLKPSNLGVINPGTDTLFYSQVAFNLIQLVFNLS